MIKLLSLLFLIALPFFDSEAQKTAVQGYIYDIETNEPVPFINVIFKNSVVGMLTDSTGYYSLKTEKYVDTLLVSGFGYHPVELPVVNGKEQEFNIPLVPNSFALDEISVSPDDGPVRRLLEKMVNNKSRNDPANLKSYSYRRYSREEYRVNNVTDRMKNSRFFRSADTNIFRYDDDSTRYMPVHFSERVLFNEHQKNPERVRSTIEAENITGLGMLEDTEISGFASQLDAGINFYNNSMEAFGQNLISPASDNGWFYYNYYLMDSVKTDSGKNYKVRFTPRRSGDNTFAGYMTIEDRYYAVKSVTAEMTNTDHLNFIKDVGFTITYDLINDSIPFFRKTEINATVDYMPVEIRKNQERVELKFSMLHSYNDISVDLEEPIELSHRSLTYETVRKRDSRNRDEKLWQQVRPSNLTISELEFRAAIDSVNQLPLIKYMDNLANMFLTGYYDLNYIGIGPYDQLLIMNEVQGTQMFIGGRTNSRVSEYFSLWGGVGYGTRNQKWLWRAGGGYRLPTQRRNIFQAEYRNDFITIGENEKILLLYENKQHTSESNIISHIFKREDLYEVHRREQMALSVESEVRTGFSIKSSGKWMRMHSPPFFPYTSDGNFIDSFDAAELGLNLRWSWRERYMDYGYRRVYMGSPDPIINLTLTGGTSSVDDNRKEYFNIHSSLKHYFFIGQTRLDYAVESGAIFGTAPYPLLNLARANTTYGSMRYNFNMINQLEFVHDRYLQTYLEYRLNGFLFKRTPLLRQTGLREVVSAKMMIGDISDRHSYFLNYPLELKSYNSEPYVEVGFGVENVLRFFRFDGIWRVTRSDEAPRFGLRARMEIRI
ncbi:DUF5686 family protein [Marinilabiliaceae bacterium ANBcel2]|nr:DUF5686 family protein [Marinilabiliaceae bacterium ANBcel2]